MRTKLLSLFAACLILASCGKKDEQPQVQQQNQQQQTIPQNQTQTQQQPQNQTQTQTEQKPVDKITLDQKKIDDAKKELDKKKDAELKKQDDEKKVEEIKQTKDDIDFSQIWPKKCFKCHGKDGKGKVEGVPDLTRSETKKKSEAELIKIISNGVKGKTEDDEDMPSWKSKLSEDEIKAAAKYVKGL